MEVARRLDFSVSSGSTARLPSLRIERGTTAAIAAPVSRMAPQMTWDLTIGAGVRASDALATEFETLAAEWHARTDHLSVTWQKELHWAYRYVIGMGEAAVPYILQDMRRTDGWWFSALEAIARKNVAKGIRDWDGAIAAWERWAHDRGLM
jgi:hypothetical protein